LLWCFALKIVQGCKIDLVHFYILIWLGRDYFAGLIVTKRNKATVLLTLTLLQTPTLTRILTLTLLQICF
jgi:hypothetical protein